MSYSIIIVFFITRSKFVELQHTSSSGGLFLNVGYVKSVSGILKLLQLILGAVAVGLVGYYYTNSDCGIFYALYTADTFFLVISVTFLIGTFLIYLSCIISMSTASLVSETVYEIVYHGFACILYLAASICFSVKTFDRFDNPLCSINGCYKAAAIIGFFITVLYLLSALYPKRSQVRGLIGR
ncbi:hypothetical protein WA026_012045 [Henosepilachna vigintioctopunctata]|uniref:MARVEL domain-containing protein n=1 Tax=Henosepilachna vigintioctopunctata TaxID=420089 RepID=A0AAW1V6G2_9CUCU